MAAKTKVFPNFYENQKEATIRLQGTVVLYEGEPHYIHAISDYKKDGILRVFCEPTGNSKGLVSHRFGNVPWSYNDPDLGILMDEWMTKNPNEGLIRKYMTSSGFDKFRPFPLGMVNVKSNVYYVERHPQRHTQQGLAQGFIEINRLTLQSNSGSKEPRSSRSIVDILSPEFRSTILGAYPSPDEVVKALNDPEIENDAAAFSRDFCIVRGPIRTLYLGYKTDIVGVLPKGDLSQLYLHNKFGYVKEVAEATKAFGNIDINS